MKRFAFLALILGLIGSAVIAQQSITEPLTIVGPYYRLETAAGAAYTISGPPGTYQVPGMSMVRGLAPVAVQVTITIPGAGDNPGPGPPVPPPQPTPIPNPPPNPPVVTGKLWAIFVADTKSVDFATSGSSQSRLWSSTTIKDSLAQPPLFTIWRHYDALDPLLPTTKWGKLAIQMGFPCFLIVDEKGNGSPCPMPATEADIVTAVRRARGL